MKRILQVIGSLRGGGAERIALTLDSGFRAQGYSTTLLVLQNNVEHVLHDAHTITLLEGSIQKFLANQEPYDCIIGHMEDTHLLLREIETPKVLNVIHTTLSERFKNRGFFTRYKKRKYYRSLYNNRHLITVSKGSAKDIDSLNITPASLHTIYNPFSFEILHQYALKPFTPPKQPYFLHVGSFNGVKRHDVLLKAYAQLEAPICDLVLLGKGSNENKMKALAKTLNIENRVHFMGWCSNPYPWMKHARALILSSDAEGLPTVLIEALALQTPIISTNCPSGPLEILQKRLAHYLVPRNHPKKLAQAMQSLGPKEHYPFEDAELDRFSTQQSVTGYLQCIKKLVQ